MPKKPTAKPAVPAYERPLPFPISASSSLKFEERARLREIISDPVFVKALRNAHALQPNKNPPGIGVAPTEHSLLIANNRLHELRGWEMFEGALFGQAEETIKRIHAPMTETYPEP